MVMSVRTNRVTRDVVTFMSPLARPGSEATDLDSRGCYLQKGGSFLVPPNWAVDVTFYSLQDCARRDTEGMSKFLSLLMPSVKMRSMLISSRRG